MAQAASAQAGEPLRGDGKWAPIRVIRDTYPTYSAVAVDTRSNEVYLQDENLYGFKVFDRMANTPSTAAFTEPKRTVGGILTKLEFNSALYVDPKNGDVYSVNNDNLDTTVVFPHDAKGHVAPMRELNPPHGVFGIVADEEAQELFFTVEHDNAVVVYRKDAKGDANPLRLLQGNDTQLEDPHGIAVDTKNQLLFVTNYGSFHAVAPPAGANRGAVAPRPNWPLDRDAAIRGSGRSEPPSISVYSLKAEGNTRPLRLIQGPKTQLNWPSTMSIDPERGEIFVANDADHSVLVFRTTDQGNAAPTRVIRGDRTGMRYPTGIFADTKHKELWVSNLGNHSATVYPLDASGNIVPLRTIRSAPRGKEALAIGNPGAVGYDSKRDEILVPN
jgi:DNA-binding beta-propeller fold protein YncE